MFHILSGVHGRCGMGKRWRVWLSLGTLCVCTPSSDTACIWISGCGTIWWKHESYHRPIRPSAFQSRRFAFAQHIVQDPCDTEEWWHISRTSSFCSVNGIEMGSWEFYLRWWHYSCLGGWLLTLCLLLWWLNSLREDYNGIWAKGLLGIFFGIWAFGNPPRNSPRNPLSND